ncbi:MAG: DUF4340 domain-containing protein [Chitinivibrionales bacterium]|nr:DUF4340 domain-containing protein [Chitinivibrionales bacterium]
MNTKKLIGMLIALVVVIGIIVVSNQIANQKPGEKEVKFFPAFEQSKCAAFLIEDKDNAVKIRRKGDIWIVVDPQDQTGGDKPLLQEPRKTKDESSKEYPADSAAVYTALDKIELMEKAMLSSTKPEKQEKYQVDTANGIRLTVWGENSKKLGSVIIGKNAANQTSHFVREVGSNNVYTTPGSVRYSFFSDPGRWRDKSIVKFNKSLVKKLAIDKQGSRYAMEKTLDTASNPVWSLVEPEKAPANNDEVKRIVDEFARFNCTDWENNDTLSDSAMGFTAPEMTITATLENGDKKTAVIGQKKGDTNKFWVKTPGKDAIFLANDWVIEKFDKNLEDLKAEEEEPKGATPVSSSEE